MSRTLGFKIQALLTFLRLGAIGTLLLLLVVFGLVITACDPSVDIKVINQTDTTLKIFFGETFIGEVVSGGKVIFPEPAIFPVYIIVAKDFEGNVVYAANFTRQYINSKKSIVIPATATGVKQSANATGK